MTPSRRRPVVSYWHDAYRVSERRACRVARMAISTFRYKSVQEPRTALRLRIREIAQTRVRCLLSLSSRKQIAYDLISGEATGRVWL